MNKNSAIKTIIKNANGPIVSANGHISRNLYGIKDRDSNFYMIGSMGLASSIALGIAIKNKEKKVFVLDGDGNILMNLGSLVTIGSLKPKNLIHYIFDNESHESTGGQPTNSGKVKLEDLARASKCKIFKISSEKEIKKIIKKIKNENGPIVVLVSIKKGGVKSIRVDIKPPKIKSRFMKSLKQK